MDEINVSIPLNRFNALFHPYDLPTVLNGPCPPHSRMRSLSGCSFLTLRSGLTYLEKFSDLASILCFSTTKADKQYP